MSLPHVSSEGGPIILGDFEALRTWRGCSELSCDYNIACELIGRVNPSPITLNGLEALIWDFGGPGTGFIVIASDAHISVVRVWPEPGWTEIKFESVVVSSASERFGTEVMANVTISSGYLLALWAPEDASKFLPPHGAQGVPGPGLSISGVYVRVPCGKYEVTTSEWHQEKFATLKIDLRKMERAAGATIQHVFDLADMRAAFHRHRNEATERRQQSEFDY